METNKRRQSAQQRGAAKARHGSATAGWLPNGPALHASSSRLAALAQAGRASIRALPRPDRRMRNQSTYPGELTGRAEELGTEPAHLLTDELEAATGRLIRDCDVDLTHAFADRLAGADAGVSESDEAAEDPGRS